MSKTFESSVDEPLQEDRDGLNGISRATTKHFVDESIEAQSYAKLKSHIAEVHPTAAGGESFACCTDMGCLPCFYWSRKYMVEGPQGGLLEKDGIAVVEIKDVNS